MRVLLFHRFDDSSGHSDVASRVIELLSDRFEGRQISVGSLPAQKGATASLVRKLRDACAESDMAIAIVQADDRKPERAAALWMEIGFWLALKGEDSLMRCWYSNDEADVLPEFCVYLESTDWKLVSTPEQIARHARDWADALGARDGPLRSDQIERIKHVLRGTSDWGRDKFHDCSTETEAFPGGCRRLGPALLLIADLVRSGEWEDEARDLLLRFSDLKFRAHEWLELSDEGGEKASVGEGLVLAVAELVHSIDAWQRHAAEAGTDSKFEWQRRLKLFLEARGYPRTVRTANAELKGLKVALTNLVDGKVRREDLVTLKDLHDVIETLRQAIDLHRQDISGTIETRLQNRRIEVKVDRLGETLNETSKSFSHNHAKPRRPIYPSGLPGSEH